MQEKMTKSPEFYAIFTIKGLGIKIFYYICARIPHGHKKIRKTPSGLFVIVIVFVRSPVQPAVGQETVEHQQFVAHAVGGVTADGGADDETKYWGCNAYNRCIAALPVAVEQGEGEQS